MAWLPEFTKMEKDLGLINKGNGAWLVQLNNSEVLGGLNMLVFAHKIGILLLVLFIYGI